jgi:hypothetical protein
MSSPLPRSSAISTRPPSGVNLSALSTRLTIASIKRSRSSFTGNVASNAGNGLDKSLDLVKHAVHDRRQLRKRIVAVSVRQTFAQIACHDARNALVDAGDLALGAHAEQHARRKAQHERRDETQGQRLTDDRRELHGLIDIAADHQRVAVGQLTPSRANPRV